MRITSRFLWIQSWITENLKWLAPGSCAARAEAVEMSPPFGNGYHLGATPGTWEEPGDRSLARVPGPGGRRAASARPGNRPASAASRAGPLHLIHGGALSHSERPQHPCWHRHATPATAGMRHRDGPWARAVRRRGQPRRNPALIGQRGTFQLTGHVCTSMWITCAQRRRACAGAVEMLGIPPPGRAHKSPLTRKT